MLENLLVNSRQVPKPGLRYAADELQSVANSAGPASTDELHSYLAPGVAADPTARIRLNDTLKNQIEHAINSVNGGLKGPAQNARNEIDTYGALAIRAHYRLSDPEVQRKFAYFLLAVVTAGFEGLDTTGTQMGTFLGSWRGGGF